MIVKFIIDNHDVVRESDNSVLLQIAADHYCWIPKQFIELYGLVQQSKVFAPDDIKFAVYKSSNMKKIWVLEHKDQLDHIENLSVNDIKNKYYKWINFTM